MINIINLYSTRNDNTNCIYCCRKRFQLLARIIFMDTNDPAITIIYYKMFSGINYRPIRFKEVRGDPTEGQVDKHMVDAALQKHHLQIVLMDFAQVDKDKTPVMERALQASNGTTPLQAPPDLVQCALSL